MALIRTTLSIDQGADFVHEWQWLTEDGGVETPKNLTGWTARLEIRETASSASTIGRAHSSLAVDGDLTVDSSGVIHLEFPAAASSAWTWSEGVYDLELVSPGGGVTRFAEGPCYLRAEVTRGS